MPVLACDLSVFTPEQREHHISVSQSLFAAVREVKELTDGYAFRLPGESPILFTLAEFIRDERLCCPFWKFTIDVEPYDGAIWLHLTGEEGVKAAVLPELSGMLSADIVAALQSH